jgi:hypothetical protein
MPYYLFTIVHIDKANQTFSEKRKTKKAGGVKLIEERDIEKVWHHWELKYKGHFGADFISFDVVQISKRSRVYKEWSERKIKE